jgi:hypothetical protein
VISGMVMARTEPRKTGCGRCCMICNGRCKVGENDSQGNHESDLRSQSYAI